jgi:hypothetical protein
VYRRVYGIRHAGNESSEVTQKSRLAVFADESGTVALDGFFLVAVLIVPQDDLPPITEAFLGLERSSDRTGRKWVRTNETRKSRFLDSLGPILKTARPIYWKVNALQGDWVAHTARTVADAARARAAEAVFRIQIDGFNPSECNVVRRAFSERNLVYRRIVGGRDESEPLLRLADSLAGFLADLRKGKPYAAAHWARLKGYFEELA